MSNTPKTTKAVTLGKAEGNPGEVWHPLIVEEKEISKLKDGQVLVKLHAAALNYREIWIRRSLYPGILHGATMGADGAGILVAPTSHPLYNKPVLVTPEVGWHKSTYGPDQPDEDFHVIGGTEGGEGRGTLSEYIVVPQDDAVECPSYLVEEKNGWDAAAALPLAAVTAYRACFTKAEVEQGQNVLITGIGGGVAMQALQFCVAKGANVYVTSSKAEKIDQAKKYGAKSGVNYKDEDWPQQLAALLPKERPSLDAVIDAAGGDIITAVLKLLKFGARVAVYGQTTEKPHILTMFAIQKNIELRGTTMGSREEFKRAVQFAAEHKIKPVVHEVYNSLEEADKAMEDLRKGNQLGKLVIRIA